MKKLPDEITNFPETTETSKTSLPTEGKTTEDLIREFYRLEYKISGLRAVRIVSLVFCSLLTLCFLLIQFESVVVHIEDYYKVRQGLFIYFVIGMVSVLITYVIPFRKMAKIRQSTSELKSRRRL